MLFLFLVAAFLFPLFIRHFINHYHYCHHQITHNRHSPPASVEYDGISFTVPLLIDPYSLYPVDCRVTEIACSTDADCQKLCFTFSDSNENNNDYVICDKHNNNNNTCKYVTAEVAVDKYCLNDGTLITYFWHDRQFRICACDENEKYFGSRCDKINPFQYQNWNFFQSDDK